MGTMFRTQISVSIEVCGLELLGSDYHILQENDAYHDN